MNYQWLPIKYRDFHDVPRAIVVEFEGQLYFLDCRFDEALDDYARLYDVYILPAELLDAVDKISWTDLSARGRRIGSVATGHLQFDQTRRRAISSRVFERIDPETEAR